MYLWIKALHVTAVIVWMASMVITPVLIAWLGQASSNAAPDRGKVLSAVRRQFQLLTTPAMLATWGLGLWMVVEAEWFRFGWFVAKLAIVIMLSAFHGVLSGLLRRLNTETDYIAPAWFQYGTLAVIICVAMIALLVILKPTL